MKNTSEQSAKKAPANNIPSLTPEQIRERNKLVEANSGLVYSIVRKKFNFAGHLHDDLVQEGMIGLMFAAERFDSKRGYTFATYAYQCISGYILRALQVRYSSSSAHIPAYRYCEIQKFKKVRQILTEQLGRNPTTEELSAHMGVTNKKIQLILCDEKILNSSSLDAPLTEDGLTLGRILPSELPRPDNEVADNDATIKREEVIRRACQEKLSPREREMLAMSFGIEGYDEDGSTLKCIGEQFELSRARVSQIIAKACERLKSVPEIRQAYEEALAA